MAKTATKKSTKPAKVEEVDEEDDDLEELEDDDATETPAKSKKAADSEIFGAAQLAAHISAKSEKKITARDLRTLLRKMARDGRIDREIVAGNKSRYEWSGPNDPEAKAITKAVLAGELEQGKKEALAKLKEQKAAKLAAKAKADKKAGKTKAKAVVEDDDDELDDDE